MKKETFADFDVADYLKSEADIAAYLDAAVEDGDPQVIAAAMGEVVRARNVSKIARDTGLTREGIYKALSPEGNPSFATVWKVARALHLDLSFRARESTVKAARVASTHKRAGRQVSAMRKASRHVRAKS